MTARSFPRFLRMACIFALFAIGLMSWSLFDPRPLPVVVAMSVGQILGTLSLVTFVAVVIADLRRARVIALHDDATAKRPSKPTSSEPHPRSVDD